MSDTPPANSRSTNVEVWNRQWAQATVAALGYVVFIAAFALGTDAITSPLDGDTETLSDASSVAFVYLSPPATILAARFLRWPAAMLLPVIFVVVCSQAIPDCPATGCRPTDGLAWIALIEWALFVPFPIALLASFRTPSEELKGGERERSLGASWGSSARAAVAYVLLVHVAADAGVVAGVSASSLEVFLEEAYLPIQFIAVSTIATAAASYQSDVRIVPFLPLGFAAIALQSFGSGLPAQRVVAIVGWTLAVVLPSVLLGSRLRMRRTGGVIDGMGGFGRADS